MSVHVLSNECLLTYVTDLGYNKNINTVSDPTAIISVCTVFTYNTQCTGLIMMFTEVVVQTVGISLYHCV